MKKPTIALVLSGGSALGFAHLGVIDELLKAGIKPDIVVGTSMGAVVGGGYACGLTVPQMIEYSQRMSMWKFIDFNFKKRGLFTGRKITKLLRKIYKDKTTDDCICKFGTVALDIVEGKEVFLDRGKILDIVRASMNIPALLVPYDIDGTKYVDGGNINNFPEDVAKNLGADIIIGVDVLRNSCETTMPRNIIDVLFKSMTILQNTLYQYKRSYSDILIAPDLRGIDMLKFKKSDTLRAIEIGRMACSEKMEEIKKLINDWKK